MEHIVKFVEVTYQFTVAVVLWAAVGYVLLNYTQGQSVSVVINEQKVHKTLIERLQERLDKIKAEEDDKHRSLLERLKSLEKRGNIGAQGDE